ncbi:hypothetical protein V2J09_021419 [Rumex salicifolius]
MEKASAACAMDWSIELEKGLRSNRPGQHLQSIQLTGHRINKWSQEPKLKLTIYNMFGIDHGEERLFADAILFRLADAFCSGDQDTKIHIVKIFLSEMKHHDIKRREGHGIFSKMSSDNHIEILKRIRVALDDGNIESKALTLVLFGCWSEIAKDFPEIRYEILSGLLSSHDMEVKASIFAAGCFAEFSYDFACAFLEYLISILASPKTISTVKVAAARAFRNMGHFHSLTNKAYKGGSEIVLKSSEADWLGTMLISLSKLASKSASLSSEQVSLLCGKITPHMQLIVLRSLRYILEKTSHITLGALLFENFLTILDNKQVPSPLRCEALQLVIKIVLHVPYDMLMYKMHELNELLTHVANAAKSPDTTDPERVLAARVLVGISNKLKGEKLTSANDLNFLRLLSEVVSSIGDEAVLQTKEMSERCEASNIELQLKSLLQLLFILIDSPPEVSLLVLDKLCTILETLVDVCRENVNVMNVNVIGIASEVHHAIRVEENDMSSFSSKIIHYVHKCLYGFAQMLCADATTSKLVHKLKNLVSFVCQCNLFHCSTHVKFALLLHSCCNFGCLLPENGKEGERRRLDKIKFPKLLEDGTLNSECIGYMLSQNDDWGSYMVGKHAARQGVWFVCDPVFRHLKASVQSDIFSCWLSCLSQFAHTEKCLQEMFSYESGSDLISKMDVPSQLNDFQQHILTSDSIEKLACSCDGILSSERLLGSTTLLKQKFCFQRWFLALRIKVLEVIIDLHKLLATVMYNKKSMSTVQQIEGVYGADCSRLTQEGEGMMHLLAGLSLKSQKIAREYDLMNSSFINMDPKSFRIISTAALSCSLLAFCIGLVYLIPNSPFPVKTCSSNNSGDCLHVTVAEDLAGRLSYIDPGTSINIISILKGDAGHESSLAAQCKSRSFNVVYEEGITVRLCKAATSRISSMQNETVGTHESSLPVEYNKRSLFLLDIIKELMSIPFCTPEFFFQVRPCIGAVLYSCSLDNENSTDVSVMSGSHLSLNLCLQLKNMPPDLTSRKTKVFCILHCKKSYLKPNSKPSFVDYPNWSTDSMLRLQERLRDQVIEQNGERLTANENETCVHFEMNGGVQGFATCLVDTSAFPVGFYSIDWHSCCVDDNGSYWSLLPLSLGPLFTVRSSKP